MEMDVSSFRGRDALRNTAIMTFIGTIPDPLYIPRFQELLNRCIYMDSAMIPRYVHISENSKTRTVIGLEMELVADPPQSIFVRHGYVQQGVVGLNSTKSPRNHM